MQPLDLDPNKVLFFPVTPFSADDEVDLDLYRQHLHRSLEHNPGAVFAACGTGEYHTLALAEFDAVVKAAVETVAARVPVFAGVGGPIAHAKHCAKAAAQAGADGLLVLPPYLVGAPQRGLIDYITEIADQSDLGLILYHRGNAQLSSDSVAELFHNPKVVGLKDGVGDLALAQQFVLIAREHEALQPGRKISFFNGLLTAELSQSAYDGIGVPYYSSAVFAMAPDVANSYLRALRGGNRHLVERLLEHFYVPLVRLRDECPGFAVALIKAGVRLTGLDVGPVRPPLIDPEPEQIQRLSNLIDKARVVIAEDAVAQRVAQ